MADRIDEIDKRILYYLSVDARNTTTSDIAEEAGVTAATIRNRIEQLEGQGILQGYFANIDFKAIDSYVQYQFRCTAPIPNRKRIAQSALEINGVLTARELMAGRSNLVITAVGADTGDITQITHKLSDLGLEIDDESVIEDEYQTAYAPFGPEEAPKGPSITDIMNLSGDAEVVEVTVPESAKVANMTIEQAVNEGLLGDEILIVGIERDGNILTPKGNTVIKSGDVISLFSKSPLTKESLKELDS